MVPSKSPSNIAFLPPTMAAMRASMPSSATRAYVWTALVWPYRKTRPDRCSSTAGFHGRSR